MTDDDDTPAQAAEPGEQPGSKPLRLPRHELFAQELVAGSMKTEAYITVYPHAAAWKPASAYVKASMLAARDDVKARVAYLQEQAASEAVFTRAQHLARLNVLSLDAQRSKDFTAAVRAEENRGKVAGFYVERVEASGPGGSPMLPSVIQLVGPDDGRKAPDPA
jgi:hypothetical protein